MCFREAIERVFELRLKNQKINSIDSSGDVVSNIINSNDQEIQNQLMIKQSDNDETIQQQQPISQESQTQSQKSNDYIVNNKKITINGNNSLIEQSDNSIIT